MKTKNSKANPQGQMAVRCSALLGITERARGNECCCQENTPQYEQQKKNPRSKLAILLFLEAHPDEVDALGEKLPGVDLKAALRRWIERGCPDPEASQDACASESPDMPVRVLDRSCCDGPGMPNDPSSATRPTRALDCNLDAMAGFAAADG